MSPLKNVLLACVLMFLVPPVLGEGQWILTAVEEDIKTGVLAKEYNNDISSSIGEIKITREHFGTRGYEPYTQISIMTWSQMPTTIRPGEKINIQLVVKDGGSSPEYRNAGILSFSQAGKRDFDFIASKYRGMEEMVDYTMPEGEGGNTLFLKIDGGMGTKSFPSATYIYTYTFTLDDIETVPLIEAKGEVSLNTNGAVIPGAAGTLVKAGDVLLSGTDGKAVVSVQKGQITMDKDTYVGVIDLDSLVLFTGRMHIKGSQELELTLPAAGMDLISDQYLIYRLKTSLDEISSALESGNDTEMALIVNEGGEFTVSVSDAGNVEIAVLRGSVDLEKGGSIVTAQEGTTINLQENNEPQIVAGVMVDEWWKAVDDTAGAKQDSPGFGLVLGAVIVVIAVPSRLKK
ncbi:MAG: hypothetical protein M8349_05840 [ANME-2 cluster archaeon]|nr:hypothetical protein [ANME-2 cluster archaeon]